MPPGGSEQELMALRQVQVTHSLMLSPCSHPITNTHSHTRMRTRRHTVARTYKCMLSYAQARTPFFVGHTPWDIRAGGLCALILIQEAHFCQGRLIQSST